MENEISELKRKLTKYTRRLKERACSALDSMPISYRYETVFGYHLRNATIIYEKAAWEDVARSEMPALYFETPEQEGNFKKIDAMAVASNLYTVRPDQLKLQISREEKLELCNHVNSIEEKERLDFLSRHPRIRQILENATETAKIKNYKASETADLMRSIGFLGSAVDRKRKSNRWTADGRINQFLYGEDMQRLYEIWTSFDNPKLRLHAVEAVSEIFKNRKGVEKVAEDVQNFKLTH